MRSNRDRLISHEVGSGYAGSDGRVFKGTNIFKFYPRSHVRIVTAKSVNSKTWRVR